MDIMKASGQAVIEFILVLFVALTIMGVISIGLKRMIYDFWFTMACEIIAPCPTCNPGEEMAAKLNSEYFRLSQDSRPICPTKTFTQ